VEADGDQIRVFSADPEGLLGDLVSIGTANGLHVRDASEAKPSLETAFLALTGREYRE
jgi:ABC-2 type transport system ATP-binding protein